MMNVHWLVFTLLKFYLHYDFFGITFIIIIVIVNHYHQQN